MNWSQALRVELQQRAAKWSAQAGVPSYWSAGSYGTLLFVNLPRFDGRVRDRDYAAAFHCSSYAAGLT